MTQLSKRCMVLHSADDNMIDWCVKLFAAYRESPLLMLAMAGCRTVWFPSISTTHFVFRSFSGLKKKSKKKRGVFLMIT